MPTPFELAVGDLNYHETPPGSNRTKYGERFFPGRPSPWCAEAASCWTRDAGARGPWNASVGFYELAAHTMGLHLGKDLGAALDALRAGDTVAVGFEWERDTWPDHMGFLAGPGPDGGHVRTLEGNSPVDGSLGDAVGYHVRPTSLVAFYSRIVPGAPSSPVALPPPSSPAPVHPAGPVLPPWMVLTWHPNKRAGFTNHGDRVGDFQAFLRRLGGPWDPGKVDGIIGPATNDLIGRFQDANHLRRDYEVGQQTWRAAFG